MGSVIKFRRDFPAALARILTFNGLITGEDLLDRHDAIVKLHDQAVEDRKFAGYTATNDIDPMICAYDNLHTIAGRAGVGKAAIDAFNEQRKDWKMWAEYRNSRPSYRNL